ncbi:hypothetical protein DYB28_002423 [Aphanomyces astaci]|uniref:Homeobox domain-containing protein n=1 Tax=Aphanomyces astaci TaxID=112090 RepID=A0A9X8DVC3_APHAT|nr:hypothetical protein DYB28_002423 [Aphanomyces astaci]
MTSISTITTSSSLSSPEKKPVKAKQRLRMDHVASVRKAVKMAREAGLSEDEIKDERSRAIQLARDRLYMNGKPLGPHPLNKDQVTHLKLQLLKLVEDDAAPECVMDILELLLSVELPVPVLLDTRLDRQLRLVAKAHQHNKDVVRLASKLSEVIQATTDAYYQASSCQVEFSLDQVETLERAFHENDSPDQDTMVQLASTLNEGDPSAPLDYKHVRSWFYKRKAAGHPLPDGHVSDHGVRTYDYFV